MLNGGQNMRMKDEQEKYVALNTTSQFVATSQFGGVQN